MLNISQVIKKFLAFCGTRRILPYSKYPQLDAILSNMNLILTLSHKLFL